MVGRRTKTQAAEWAAADLVVREGMNLDGAGGAGISSSASLRAEASGLLTRSAVVESVASGGLDVFEAIRRLDEASGRAEDDRKRDGVVYTPRWIADAMLDMLAPEVGATILEPSCGRGVFVFALAERILAAGVPARRAAETLASTLTAAEFDAVALEDLRALWRAFWAARGVAEAPLPTLRCGDSLDGVLAARRFDAVVGNPPYVRFQNLRTEVREQLERGFVSCAAGNVDLYHAFVEFSTAVADRVCLIIPNSWMSTRSGAALRALIRPRLAALVDFGQELVFAPVRAYVSILLLDAAGTMDGLVALAKSPRALVSEPTHRPRSDALFASARWHVHGESSCAPRTSRTIGSMAKIHSGIATLADAVFKIVPDGPAKGGTVDFYSTALGRPLTVPEAQAPRLVKLTKATSLADILASSRILYPYDSRATLIAESVLRETAPALLDHLAAHRTILAGRDKGNTSKHEAWYAYGRRQGIGDLPSGPLICLAGMSKDGLRPFRIEGAAAGRFLFTSGFVLSPLPGHSAEEVLAALEDPRLWAWLKINGKEWASPEGSYRSYGARLLASAPVF